MTKFSIASEPEQRATASGVPKAMPAESTSDASGRIHLTSQSLTTAPLASVEMVRTAVLTPGGGLIQLFHAGLRGLGLQDLSGLRVPQAFDIG